MSDPTPADVVAAVAAGVARIESLVRTLAESHPLTTRVDNHEERILALERWRRRAIWWWGGGVALAALIGGLVGYSLGAG